MSNTSTDKNSNIPVIANTLNAKIETAVSALTAVISQLREIQKNLNPSGNTVLSVSHNTLSFLSNKVKVNINGKIKTIAFREKEKIKPANFNIFIDTTKSLLLVKGYKSRDIIKAKITRFEIIVFCALLENTNITIGLKTIEQRVPDKSPTENYFAKTILKLRKLLTELDKRRTFIETDSCVDKSVSYSGYGYKFLSKNISFCIISYA